MWRLNKLVEDDIADHGKDSRDRHGEDPGKNNFSSHAPADSTAATGGADTHDGTRNSVGGADRKT